jgi:CRISPR-associated protein Cmr5
MANNKTKSVTGAKSTSLTATVEAKKMPATDATKKTDDKKVGNLDQQRAAYAWQCVQGCNGDYANLAKAAPALIMTNGLMQTLAYYQEKGKNYQEKGKNHHLALSKHLREWLKCRFKQQINDSDFSAIMQALFNTADASFYRQTTEESLALLRWIRQFAAAKTGG